MTFASVNAAVLDLTNSLRAFVGKGAIGDITVRPPSGERDEASFLRLVAWSYAFAFEAGRVAIPYLMELPAGRAAASLDPVAARELVRALRTWSFHNLGFGSDRDAAMSRRVQRWFMETCGEYPPRNEGHWNSCFVALCTEVLVLVNHCQGAMTYVLAAPDDGETTTADLRRRIDRAWPAHEFHKLVADASTRMGIVVDARLFSASRLGRWQEFLKNLPDRDDLMGHVGRVIERDLLEHAVDVLPIDGRDIMEALDLEPGPAVGAALYRARELFRGGIRDSTQLLEVLRKERSSETD